MISKQRKFHWAPDEYSPTPTLCRKYPDVVFVKVLENEMPTEIQVRDLEALAA